MKRNKSVFEKWFSRSRHKRRDGAKELSSLINTDFKNQQQIITGEKIIYTHGSSNDVGTHFAELRNEFIGSSELCFTHAKIIVLIRREFEVKKHFALFEDLWQSQEKKLLKSLNTRWLIAASDTFADYSTNKKTKALALSCSMLINTIKIVETENLIKPQKKDNQDIIDKLQKERIALFDGTSAFAVGTDDTLRNMRWRMDKIAKDDVCGKILLEIFNRLQGFDSVYARFKDRHTRDKTGWWV
jgi:hypothetical protein